MAIHSPHRGNTTLCYLIDTCPILCSTSGPQGKVVPHTIVDDPADWTAETYEGKEDEYTYQLTKEDVNEIISAVERIRTKVSPTEESVIQVSWSCELKLEVNA